MDDCGSKPVNNLSTLVDVLYYRSQYQPDRTAYTFLVDGEFSELHLTYAELGLRVRTLAATLQRLDSPGNRVLLLYPPGLEFIVAFLSCLATRFIAVPAYPIHGTRHGRALSHIRAIVRDASPSLVLTTSTMLSQLKKVFEQDTTFLQALRIFPTDTSAADSAETWQASPHDANTLAFLQYTSGSTGTPKGVMVSHANLMHNLSHIQRCFQTTPESQGVIWLPPYHDMGLIGGILEPLYVGFPVTLLAPAAFLQRPFRWLQAISRYRATISGGPNFAYDLCVQKVAPEQRASLDLSSWKLAFNGAEPVQAETLDRFATTFAFCGFHRTAFYPCYGLAEATLIAAGGNTETPPVIRSSGQTQFLTGGHDDLPASTEDKGHRPLVGCGQPLQDQRLVIVHPDSHVACQPGQVGEIWIAGQSVTQGYWNREEESRQTFHAYLADNAHETFLRTSDLGFFQDGELFVTGRLKDLIIIRGRNHYPQDIEATVERSHPALRRSSCAAFTIHVGSGACLVIVAEAERQYRHADRAEVIGSIREAVADQHELHVYAVLLLKPGGIPRTSSGKIQRYLCRTFFLNGELDVLERSILDQTKADESKVDVSREMLMASNRSVRQEYLERYLQQQISSLVGIAATQVDCQQPFSQFGLDSLMAFELSNRIETDLQVEIPMTLLLQGLSVHQLVMHILEQLNAETGESIPHILPSQPMQHAPLSFAQERLWFLDQFSPRSAAYSVPAAVRMKGVCHRAAFQQSLNEIIRRHDILRTTYAIQESQLYQIVLPSLSLPLPIIDLRHLAPSVRETEVMRLLKEETARPFDLAKGPLIRAVLFQLDDEEHILLILLHHIITDGWSMGVLVRELGVLYEAHVTDQPPKLSAPPIQYTDYVIWQRKWLQNQALERQVTFWVEQLSGAPLVLELPADRPRPPLQTFRGATLSFTLPDQLLQAYKAFCRDEGITLFMALLSAFATVLFRYTGQTNVIVGTPIANRTRPELQDLIGCFVNTLALRIDFSGNPIYRDLLRRVQKVALNAYMHQNVPFEKVVEAMQPTRDLGRTPLVQVMFVLQKSLIPDLALTGLTLHPLVVDSGSARFDLTLTLEERDRGLIGSVEFNTDIFEASTIQRMVGHLQRVFECLVADPEQHLTTLTLLTEEERQQRLLWNATDVFYSDGDMCLHQVFERQVMETPAAIAVTFEDELLTYAELNSRANQLAHYLQKSGVGLETFVGIYMERSLEMVIGLLGVLKAGGAYVPLAPSYPTERLTFMLSDASIALLLTQARLLNTLPLSGLPIVCVDSEWGMIAQQSVENSVNKTTTMNLAYVIYTSGSTGVPKGVMNTHGGIQNRLQWMQQAYHLDTTDRVLQKTPFSFDVSVWEFFWPLLTGASLVLARPEGHRESSYLLHLIQEQHITTLHFVPSMLQIFLKEEDVPNCKSIRRVFCSGEALSVRVQEQFFAQLDADLYNLYGPTEAAVDVTSWTCLRTPDQQRVPIGYPIANIQIYVLDVHLQPVPVGVLGELHIGGIGIARGYHNRPDLTADKFVPDPFSAEPGARLYKTGDIVRYLPDGAIEFLGRSDDQVKVRGFRIELGEIESTLLRHAGVQETSVLVHEDMPGERYVIAYVVPVQGATPTVSELRSFLQRKLPEYCMPSIITFIDALPLTPSGKVNRLALPRPERRDQRTDMLFVAPQTQLEQTIARVWQEVLHLDSMGRNDNFFDLGGHSLLIIEVQRKLHKELRKEIALVELFRYPTIFLLARYLSQSQDEQPQLKQSITRAEARKSAIVRLRDKARTMKR
ncbi:non-ribosomal peptide synthetase [Dictyobacter arantiisoli]|uniref:Non-ribosomal peptide synthetase n=2 Tax=Dictyobacter arantiisoli TaxID=2014874 RepID=A0A5A5TGI4_9CHLR|nr:non-ribosomal peptide synthetase [Dictyobacter arantiisoli]